MLLRSRDGRWLGLARSVASGRWRWQTIRPDGPRDLIGPAGLALERNGRPVVAYALWHASHRTVLRLVRTDARGAFRTRAVTRKGFPETPTPAGAAPVVLPNGQIRVVETFTPAAIEWRPIPGDWIGQFLHSSALGFPTGTVATAVAGSTVYAAWTEAFPTLGPPAVVLASHGSHAQGAVAMENAVLAALVLTPAGPELAANRCAGDPASVSSGTWVSTGSSPVMRRITAERASCCLRRMPASTGFARPSRCPCTSPSAGS